MFLLDTDVLSALRKRERDPNLLAWMGAQRTADLYLSVVSVGEVERGVTRQQHRDPAFARALGRLVGQRADAVRRPHSFRRRSFGAALGPSVPHPWPR